MLAGPQGDDTRFAFGKNWNAFLDSLDDERIAEAERSIKVLLSLERLSGLTMLDIGSGSGLFSLAARRLGARVHSFDYDRDSVACTQSLRDRFFPGDPSWVVEQGSVLDTDYVGRLGNFDIVYSWGVLHHTGAMYRAIENAVTRVAPGGLFCIALYCRTPLCWAWKIEKKLYVNSPRPVQALLDQTYVLGTRAALWRRGKSFAEYLKNYKNLRGMEYMTNVRDWMGGYPYESISEQEMLALGKRLKLEPVRRFCMKPPHGLLGTHCDEYVFRAST